MSADDANPFPAVIARYSEVDYLALVQRLGIYTRRLIGRRHLVWSGMARGRLPKGMTVEDIVGNAIVDSLDGTRHWNRQRYSTEYSFLCSVIRSMVHKLAVCSENKGTGTPTGSAEEGGEADCLEELILCPQSSQADRLAASEFLDKFKATLAEEEDLQLLIMAFEDGATKRSELAAALGVSPEQIDNMTKRLLRRLEDFQQDKT